MIHQMEDLINLAEFDECCCDALGDILTLFHSCDRRLERILRHSGANDVKLSLIDHRLCDSLFFCTESHRYHTARVAEDPRLQAHRQGTREACRVKRYGAAMSVCDLLDLRNNILSLGNDHIVSAVFFCALKGRIADITANHGLAALRLTCL